MLSDSMLNKKRNLLKVLDRIKLQIEGDNDYVEPYADFIEDMLDEMQTHDIFGTEGQCDPRGDMRDHSWCISDEVQ